MAQRSLLHLSLIPGVGPAVVEKIVSRLSVNRLDDVYGFLPSDFCAIGVPRAMATVIVKGLSDQSLLEKELALIERHGVSWTSVMDDDYPALLKEIHLPPTILYWRGVHPAQFQTCIAIVGARKAHAYAHRVTRQIVPTLVQHGVTVVSGGALGADTFAHREVLFNQGATVAVIGSGLLQPYPGQNKHLFEEIIASGGTVMSPFALMAPPLPGNFPARNRIIAGLSRVCLVVQAAAKSGALITAQFALNEGREVCAVPGPIDDELSAGCNALIAQGAHMITSEIDLMTIIGSGEPISRIAAIQPAKHMYVQDSQRVIEGDSVVGLCKAPISFDELLEKTDLKPDQLHEKLFGLQLEGKVEQNFMGLWCAH